MLIKTKNFSEKELRSFKDFQRTSFEILQSAAQELAEGVTEKEAARKLVKSYKQAGVKTFFHLPVVLFGERTALPGKWGIGSFFPKSKALETNQAVIMDAAPLFNGFLVDTSYSFCFGSDPEHEKMMAHLAEYRDTVPKLVNEGRTFKEISEYVQSRMAEADYQPVHHKHPGEVLGHRAIKTADFPLRPKMQGFDAISLSWFKLKDSLAEKRIGNQSPLWNASGTSDHKPHDGLWLVEPHAGNDRIGAKWEEILIIENGHSRWLEERPPHVVYWEGLLSKAS